MTRGPVWDFGWKEEGKKERGRGLGSGLPVGWIMLLGHRVSSTPLPSPPPRLQHRIPSLPFQHSTLLQYFNACSLSDPSTPSAPTRVQLHATPLALCRREMNDVSRYVGVLRRREDGLYRPLDWLFRGPRRSGGGETTYGFCLCTASCSIASYFPPSLPLDLNAWV